MNTARHRLAPSFKPLKNLRFAEPKTAPHLERRELATFGPVDDRRRPKTQNLGKLGGGHERLKAHAAFTIRLNRSRLSCRLACSWQSQRSPMRRNGSSLSQR